MKNLSLKIALWLLLASSSLKINANYNEQSINQYTTQYSDVAINDIKQLSILNWHKVEPLSLGKKVVCGGVKFNIRNPYQVSLLLEIVGHFNESITIFIYQNDSLVVTKNLKTRNQNDLPHRYFLLDLPSSKNLNVHVESYNYPKCGLKFLIKIWNIKDFIKSNQTDIWIWALFTGIMMMTVLLSIFNFIFSHQYIYIYYGCSVLCFTIYALLNDGWGILLPENLSFLYELGTINHWINVGLLFFILFCKKFLVIDFSLNPRWSLLQLNPLWVFLNMELCLIGNHLTKYYSSFIFFDFCAKMVFIPILIYGGIWLCYVTDAIKRKFKPVWLHMFSVGIMISAHFFTYFLLNYSSIKVSVSEMDIFRIALTTDVMMILISWLYRQKNIEETNQFLELENKKHKEMLYRQTIKELTYQNSLQAQKERLARDLHDGIGSQLTHIIGRIDLLALKEDNRNQLVSLGDFIRETNQSLRETIWVLDKETISSEEFSQRVIGYLARICEDIENPVVTHSFAILEHSLFSPQIASSLFYIIQEGLNNALKYACATHIHLALSTKHHQLLLSIEDDGKGFDVLKASKGYGLNNINKRTEELNGICTINSSENGSTIKIVIPINENT